MSTPIPRPLMLALATVLAASAARADVPDWLRTAAAAATPAHDEKTNAVVLHSEFALTVQPDGHMRELVRQAIRILRPEGEERGIIRVNFDSQTRIVSLRGWSLPQGGKEFAVKERDAGETSLFGVANGELVSDVHTKVLQIPAATVGNVIGYEYEQDVLPYLMTDYWPLQDTVPVREQQITLRLPPGWDYKAMWSRHAAQEPARLADGALSWSFTDLPALKEEDSMPPWQSLSASLAITLVPPAGSNNTAVLNWADLGRWQQNLMTDRTTATPEIKAQVASLVAGKTQWLDQVRALAAFVQSDVRYVAIHLGIGGFQPHAAGEVLAHRYGDCKDKSTLLATMLHEIGVQTHFVLINTSRDVVSVDSAPGLWFDHMMLAIDVPDAVNDPSLLAVARLPKIGRILYFDPTDELTPLGRLSGILQYNYGLLVAPQGSELLRLPQLPAAVTGIVRNAKFTLDTDGILRGDVIDTRNGDDADYERQKLRDSTQEADRQKMIENKLAGPLADFAVTKAAIGNLHDLGKPLEWHYSIEAEHFAKQAGDLLLVRPRVLGSYSTGFLETREPRTTPVAFPGPSLDRDSFEIALPAGYEVDELPPPVDVDLDFASYHSKSERVGNVLRYQRSFEIKKLTVPLDQVEKLRRLYSTIWGDERATAVVKRSGT